MILGQLTSAMVQDHNSEDMEIGSFEQDVHVEEDLMKASGDVRSYAYKTVAAYLANAVKTTQLEIAAWSFTFSDRAVRRYNLPAGRIKF